MSPLVPSSQTGLPVPAPIYTEPQVRRELKRWSENLAKAKADGDILATDTAFRYLDTWLDRMLALEAAA